ncbi:integrator complex subunit 6-like [Brevipalpus obovatus]|uniref:integrator complex subunit 6-like n=1 Tax=Brevipalpus obovatus TaxID=246614 RepID=UPI003D9EBE55
MTIIVFLIDNSASMNQRTYLGARPTLLDVAKDSVEKFLRIRQKDVASRQDRYMLLTFDEFPYNIKAGWKENHNIFMNELKNLSASGMTLLGPALKNCFDLLNLNRMQTGIDTYGQGRSPFYLEPCIIIAITDGGKITSERFGVQEELNLPMTCTVPGAELTKEPFRWDQRLYALVLRLTGTPPTDHLSNGAVYSVPSDESPINAMCEVTGGRSYSISSQRSLMQCLESVIQKIQGGVVVHFEKFGMDPPPLTPDEETEEAHGQSGSTNGQNLGGLGAPQNLPPPGQSLPNGFVGGAGNNSANNNSANAGKPPWISVRKLIYVQKSAQKGYSVGFWPIPESFWPDLNKPSLLPRNCHPVIKFTCANSDPMVIDNLPFDKYELETSPLTQYILSRKQPHVAWQCFVPNSHKSLEYHPLGHPFGYLKASTNLSCVNFFVLPYNYPILLPLLDDLFKIHHCKPTREWKAQFDAYLNNIPLYYAAPLKRAIQKMGGPNLIPDNMENCLNYSVLNQLKRLKNQAKVEFEKVIASVGTGKPTIPTTIKVPNSSNKKISDLINSSPSLRARFAGLRNEINDYTGFSMRISDKVREAKPQCYRNPYDITRNSLIDQIHRMRTNFLQPPNLIKYYDDDHIHNLPVSQMGNYQEYLKKMPTPLRELEQAPVRQHMFGNPFKIDKRGYGMIDEADIDLAPNNSPVRSPRRPIENQMKTGSPRVKRRPGPLPKDFVIPKPYRPSSPSNGSFSPSSPASPVPSDTSSPPASPFSSSSPISSPEPQASSPSSTMDEQMSDITSESSRDSFISNNSSQEELLFIEPDNNVNSNDKSSRVGASQQTNSIFSGATANVLSTKEHNISFNSTDALNGSKNSTGLSNLSPSSSPSPTNFPSTSSSLDKKSSSINHSDSVCNGTSSTNEHPVKVRLRLTPSAQKLREEVFKLVRKPGKNYQPLIEKLSQCQGSLKETLKNEAIAEATRFKRKALVDKIRESVI